MTNQPSDGKPREEVETQSCEAGGPSHSNRQAAPASSTFTVTVPIRIESLNKTYTEHWRVRSNRNTSHRAAVWFSLKAAKATHDLAPCTVTLTRIAPRRLDAHENLRAGFKSAVDAVADWIGLDDADERIDWQYAQRRGKPKEYAAEIKIESRP